MAANRAGKGNSKKAKATLFGETKLRRGDTVMVISGGNKKVRPIKGQTGKITRLIDDGQRAIVEGLNRMTRHQKAKGPDKPAGKVSIEAPINIARLMYYAEKIKRPVRLSVSFLTDGTKVRGYKDPKSKEFVQI